MLHEQDSHPEDSRATQPPLWLRVCATWLLSSVILSVVLGPWIGIPVGLVIALGYLDAAVRHVFFAARRPRERERVSRGSAVARR
jgi:hypothetical protein